MRKQVPFLSAFFALAVLSLSIPQASQAQAFSDAGSYMTFIGDQQREIMKDYMSYTSAVAHGKSARKVENRRKELIQTVTETRKKIGSMGPYQGDKTLRDSTSAFLLISYHILTDDYGKIVNMEEVAEQSYDAMEAYLLAQDMADEKLQQASKRLQSTEKTFAGKHNIRLIENNDELSQKVQKANKVNNYYHEIYLIFFKSYKQELYLMDAIQQKNVNGIEQGKNTLAQYAAEGLTKLNKLQGLEGDKSLIMACRQTLEFYQSECKNSIPGMTNFYLKEENFAKIKKAFDSKREKDRTQADVNQYNNAVNELNKAVNEYNNSNKQVNADRQKAIENWNKTTQSFLDKHVPKYRKA